ncbi:hypothetical protein D0Z08_26255 [Nocardioides immobilis]|uniref:Uncharacterized protein n=1 Tax=Nocardioides immobilis TaxID=2049295 RepID=A0A417XU83_9ACTN|nr:hypothetical protein D0Z08_26255 [Nocardioides immobilis]
MCPPTPSTGRHLDDVDVPLGDVGFGRDLVLGMLQHSRSQAQSWIRRKSVSGSVTAATATASPNEPTLPLRKIDRGGLR